MAFTEVSHYRVLANYLGSRRILTLFFFFFFQHPWEIFWVCSQGNDMHGLGASVLFTHEAPGLLVFASGLKNSALVNKS